MIGVLGMRLICLRIMVCLLLLAFALGLCGCGHSQRELIRFDYVEIVMGVEAQITCYTTSEDHARSSARLAFDRMHELDRVLSDYNPNSELMRLCTMPAETPFSASDDLLAVLARAEAVSRLTDGAFDVTVGPYVRLWRAARKNGTFPDQADIDAARSSVGWRFIDIDPIGRTVRLNAVSMQLDMGAIGKGYAADEALRVLARAGCERALVNIGGDLATGDPPPNRPTWRIVRPAWADGAGDVVFNVSRQAVVTSGDTFQHLEADGVVYSHIIDPRTGWAVSHRMMVTVTAPDAITADAIASAVSVLGVKAGYALVLLAPEVECLIEWIDEDGAAQRLSTKDLPLDRALPATMVPAEVSPGA